MIYEVRTYDMKPGTVADFEKAFGESLPHREKYSPLAAFWHTDIGPLNQVIHVWPYENMEERNRIRAEASKDAHWPPNSGGNIINQNSEIWTPAEFMRPMGGGQKLGGIYEMRIYTYEPGSIPELLRKWSEAIPDREKVSPLAAGMYTELGNLNRWCHVWPYKDLGDRERARKEATKLSNWPSGAPGRIKQENKILIPAEFSPMA
jgi:hypothetical protein